MPVSLFQEMKVMKNKTKNSRQAADVDFNKNVQENTGTPKHSHGAFNEEPTNSVKGGSIPSKSKPPQKEFDDESNAEQRRKNSNGSAI